jgi:hypothetical protein
LTERLDGSPSAAGAVAGGRKAPVNDYQRVVYEETDRLGGSAWASPIFQAVTARLGRGVSIGAFYVALGDLEDEGWLRSQLGEPPEDGIRRRRYYYVARREESSA